MITALTLAFVIVGGIGVYAAWVHAAYPDVSLPAQAAGAALVYAAIVALVTLLWFLLAWIHRTPRPPEARLTLAGSLRLFLGEYVALLGSAWRMGFGWWGMREPAPAPAPAPVLLIHGVLCNGGVWLGVRGKLRAHGVGPIYTLTYGPPLASIEAFADALALKIAAVRAATGAAQVALVGHSMGGLVARAYLRRFGTGHVARLVTIGTPHRGSTFALLCPGTALRQMRRGNAWLDALNAAPLPPVPIDSIWSWHDSMVAPQDSGRLPGAANIAIIGVGHNALPRDRGVIATVAAALTGIAPPAASTRPAAAGKRGAGAPGRAGEQR